jgi:hypothetical protein
MDSNRDSRLQSWLSSRQTAGEQGMIVNLPKLKDASKESRLFGKAAN